MIVQKKKPLMVPPGGNTGISTEPGTNRVDLIAGSCQVTNAGRKSTECHRSVDDFEDREFQPWWPTDAAE
jgi:hypothetical protein